jgi:hypothetical protein
MESTRPRVAVPKEDAFAVFATAPALDVAELRADLDEAVGHGLGDPCGAPGQDSDCTDNLA